MSIPLSGIENKLRNLIEIHLFRFLPMPDVLQQLSEQIANVLRSCISDSQPLMSEQNLPQEFLLLVHPSKFAEWQNESHILDGMSTVIQLAAKELGVSSAYTPTITVMPDSAMQINGLNIRINTPENLSETKTMAPVEESSLVKAAFLIIGGTNIYNITQSVINIGRRLDNHIILDDPRVSRYHAQIRYIKNRFIVFDLNSTGGTYINGERITQSYLYPGDVISLAGFPLVFGQDAPPARVTKGDTAPFTPVSGERPTIALDKFPGQTNKK